MEEKMKNRKPKENGIIGRTSKKEQKAREDICKMIINENHALTKKQFLQKYTYMLEQKGHIVPSEQTLIKDAKKFNITFQNGVSEHSEYTLFNYLGSLLLYDINQIRLDFNGKDFIILDINSYSYKISDIKSTFKIINNTHKENILDTSPICIKFILKERGLEKYIENTFEKELTVAIDYLYIETNSYCTKIIFEYKSWNTIINKVCEIVEMFEPI